MLIFSATSPEIRLTSQEAEAVQERLRVPRCSSKGWLLRETVLTRQRGFSQEPTLSEDISSKWILTWSPASLWAEFPEGYRSDLIFFFRRPPPFLQPSAGADSSGGHFTRDQDPEKPQVA